MPTPVTVAVHIDRADAIRAGRNAWGWLETTLDLEELDSTERGALASCDESGGILRLTHDTLHSFHPAPSEILVPDLTEATPKTARAVLHALIKQRNHAIEAATTTAGAIRADGDAKIVTLKSWLDSPASALIQENQRESFSDRRFYMSHHRVELPKLDWRHATDLYFFSPYSKEQGRIVRDAVDETQAKLSEIWGQNAAEIAAHETAIRTELNRQRDNFDTVRGEAAKAQRLAIEAAADARRTEDGIEALCAWAVNHGHSALSDALNSNDMSAITDALRHAVFGHLSDVPRYRRLAKADILAANAVLVSEADGLKAVFDTADDDFSNDTERSITADILKRMWNKDIPAQAFPRVHRGQLTRRGQNIGESVLSKSVLINVKIGELIVSREFALSNS